MGALERYAERIEPWAHTVAQTIVGSVNLKERAAWDAQALEMSAHLRDILKHTPVGQITQSLVHEQVKLFKSLPLRAADRVYDIQNKAIEAAAAGGRPDTLAAEIMRSGEVAESRARMIARTEIGRASTALTQARSLAIGSEGYIWRTSGGARHSHAKMEGKYVRWDSPPTLDGMTGHAGTLPNCQCYPEVTFPKD